MQNKLHNILEISRNFLSQFRCTSLTSSAFWFCKPPHLHVDSSRFPVSRPHGTCRSRHVSVVPTEQSINRRGEAELGAAAVCHLWTATVVCCGNSHARIDGVGLCCHPRGLQVYLCNPRGPNCGFTSPCVCDHTLRLENTRQSPVISPLCTTPYG